MESNTVETFDKDDSDDYDDNNNLIKISYSKKRHMIEKVKLLGETQREEIYKLIFEDTEKFTEKTDGIIVNLNNLSEKCIVNIYNYVRYNEDTELFPKNE
jgi:hypothetical protein